MDSRAESAAGLCLSHDLSSGRGARAADYAGLRPGIQPRPLSVSCSGMYSQPIQPL